MKVGLNELAMGQTVAALWVAYGVLAETFVRPTTVALPCFQAAFVA